MTEKPFQSLKERTDFEPKVELARKWIMQAALRLGYEESAITVEQADSLTLRLTIEDHGRDKEYPFSFTRTQIEGIADSNDEIRREALQAIQITAPRRM